MQASTDLPPGTSGCFNGLRWDGVNFAGATQYNVEELCSTTSASRVEAFPIGRTYKRLQRGGETVCEVTKPINIASKGVPEPMIVALGQT